MLNFFLQFNAIINKAIAADLIVLATPVYWYAMSGSMKDFMDRFSDLMSGATTPTIFGT